MSAGKKLIDGIFQENPVFRLMLGLVPAVGATTLAWNSLYLGLVTGGVMVVAAIIMALLQPLLPKPVRPVLHIAVLVVLVTLVERLWLNVNPEMLVQLGIYVPLIVVNSMILQHLGSFQNVGEAVIDAVGKGIGFTLALVLIGVIREFLAFGRVFGAELVGGTYPPFATAATIPGSLLIVGLLMGLINFVTGRGGQLNE